MQLLVAPTSSSSLLLKVSGNGNGRLKPAKVVKRDGQEATYDSTKIVNAVRRCFVNSCEYPDNEATTEKAKQVVIGVEHLLMVTMPPITVEMIQDKVETVLMANGYFDEAKEYILYRENRRKLREEQAVDPDIVAAFQRGTSHFVGPNRAIQMFQAMDKFARFNYSKGRREVWPESVARTIRYARQHVLSTYAGQDPVGSEGWSQLEHDMLTHSVSPSMRLIQMAGPALERCQTGVYNCSFQFLQGPTDLAEEMYLLCQGCGVGFSVEYQHAVDKWPRVRKQRNVAPDTFNIPDTTEGWCDAMKLGLERWLEGHDLKFNFDGIRKAGAILRTKGGRASGPQPLKDCLSFARNTVLGRQGGRLTSLDIHDMACYVHRISGVGGVRRASGISLSDLDDLEMRNAKSGQFWNENPQRSQANNSAVYEEKPDAVAFMEEWLALAKSGSGERGIFNRGGLKYQLPQRRKHKGIVFGCNPCGEINMRHKSFCNLSMAIIRASLEWAEIRRRVVQAAIWGTVQSTMTNFSYVGSTWRKNCEEERLLGVDLAGHLDHPALRPGAAGLEERLRELRDLAVATNVEWAKRLGINPSVAVTCGKPGGDSSVLYDFAPGFKAWHGKYFIRRARVQANNPVGQMLMAQGVPGIVDYEKSGMMVLEFPCMAPDHGLILGGQTALEQLEHWKTFKKHYTEHNLSVTIYVKDDEWLSAGHWVYENWDIVGGLAFNPYDGGHYPLAPYETIDEAEYQQRAAAIGEIDWSQIVKFESDDMTSASSTPACTGDKCSL